MPTSAQGRIRRGRPPSSTPESIEESSMALLLARGFDEVSVAELAEAAGISRATFFRYFPTKADVVWRGFDRMLDRLEHGLACAPAELETMRAIREAISDSVRAGAADQDLWWTRFMLINAHRSLGHESFDRWARWTDLVTRFVADRMGVPEGHPLPSAIAWAHQGVFVAILRSWVNTSMDAETMQQQMLDAMELVGTEMSGLLTATGGPRAEL